MARKAESRSKRGQNGESEREEYWQDGKNSDGTGVESLGKEAIRIRRQQLVPVKALLGLMKQ